MLASDDNHRPWSPNRVCAGSDLQLHTVLFGKWIVTITAARGKKRPGRVGGLLHAIQKPGVIYWEMIHIRGRGRKLNDVIAQYRQISIGRQEAGNYRRYYGNGRNVQRIRTTLIFLQVAVAVSIGITVCPVDTGSIVWIEPILNLPSVRQTIMVGVCIVGISASHIYFNPIGHAIPIRVHKLDRKSVV